MLKIFIRLRDNQSIWKSISHTPLYTSESTRHLYTKSAVKGLNVRVRCMVKRNKNRIRFEKFEFDLFDRRKSEEKGQPLRLTSGK